MSQKVKEQVSEIDKMSRQNSVSSGKSSRASRPVKIVNGMPVVEPDPVPVVKRKPTNSSHEFDAGSNGTSY